MKSDIVITRLVARRAAIGAAAAAVVAAIVPAPAAAFRLASVQVQGYRAVGDNPFGQQLYYDVELGDSVSTTRSTPDGYASALSSPAKGGTVSTTAFALSEAHLASATYHYDLLLTAPPTASAKIKIAYSGTLSSWGSGTAFAFLSIGDHFFDPHYSYTEFLSSDPAGKARTRAIKGSVTYTLYGGVSVPFDLDAGARVNDAAVAGSGKPGFAFAYLDPTVTVAGVPEPASWALMVAGFGLIGMTRRRAGVTVAA